ncbi:MAG: hypothetical protein KDJ99_28750 [Candidatus Competibacteraceae bacterium]|nr:hypothetical protein [Candidatus Competibacteraceae bacterium]
MNAKAMLLILCLGFSGSIYAQDAMNRIVSACAMLAGVDPQSTGHVITESELLRITLCIDKMLEAAGVKPKPKKQPVIIDNDAQQ